MNTAEITFKSHGVTFDGVTLLDAKEVQEAIQTIHSNFELKLAELAEENRKLEECFDDCYAELGKVQHELNEALKEQGE